MNQFHRLFAAAVATIGLWLACAMPAFADPCVSLENSLFPGDCRYASSPGSSLTFANSSSTIVLNGFRMGRLPLPPSAPPALDSFFDVFQQVDLGPIELRSGSGLWRTNPLPLQPLPTFAVPIELLQMDLIGPAGFMLRESPTQASQGQASATDQGGGVFRIDSFFDVFVELSIDNGTTWLPSTSGPLRMSLQSVPEPASLALLGSALLLLAARRRRS